MNLFAYAYKKHYPNASRENGYQAMGKACET
jgi:hypothetical protein